jgi:hypothetical protein
MLQSASKDVAVVAVVVVVVLVVVGPAPPAGTTGHRLYTSWAVSTTSAPSA